MHCRQSQATRRKWFRVIKLNIYCFHTFKNICVCKRGNASKAVDRCSTAMVSRDLSRLRTSRAIMLCGKEFAVIVDLPFRIMTCRFLLATVSRTWDLVCINLSFASREFVCARSTASAQMTSISHFCIGTYRRGHHALRERQFATLRLQATASHYFIHWFDATNFSEQPNDVIFNGDTSLFDSFHCNNAT